MRDPAAWHCRLMQSAREMKLRPAHASAGLRDPTTVASAAGDVGGGAIDFAAAGGRVGGSGRCTGEGTASGVGAAAIAFVASAATGAGTFFS